MYEGTVPRAGKKSKREAIDLSSFLGNCRVKFRKLLFTKSDVQSLHPPSQSHFSGAHSTQQA
jgi:hypothetical protein